jgi:hypothetical protein
MYFKIKNFIKKTLPVPVVEILKTLSGCIEKLIFKIKIHRIQHNYKRVLKRVQKKEKVKVVFLLMHHADWKYEVVYRLMDKDERFEPVVIVCPYSVYGNEFMLNVMDKAYNSFKEAGYNVIKSYNSTTGIFLDITKEIIPDVVCFTSPWKLTMPGYLIDNFFDTLTCYVPYGYETSHLHEVYYNSEMQNFVWKFYLENYIHKTLSLKYSTNKSCNIFVSGYPGMDRFFYGNNKPKDVWKIKDRKVKRVIWAAHHSIPGMGASLDYSTFLDYYDSMLQIADNFKDKIQIAFKPHPILMEKLSNSEIWGKVRTEEYFQKWQNLENGQLEEGDYMDLFFTSDAIIHDCGSFVAEYMYTGNPVMYLMKDENIAERFNEVGQMALKTFYHGKNLEDIYIFFENVILGEYDSLKTERDWLFKKVINAPGDLTASENIFNNLVSEIFDTLPRNER